MVSHYSSFIILALALLVFQHISLIITGYKRPPVIFFPLKDIFGEKHFKNLAKIKRRFLSTWTLPVLLTIVGLLLTPWWNWGNIDTYHIIRPIIIISSTIITWRAISMDIDLATGKTNFLYRFLMFLSCFGVWYHPAFTIILLHIGTTWLRSYYHHQHLSIRLIFMLVSCLIGLSIINSINLILETPISIHFIEPVYIGFMCVVGSHYFIPGLKKMQLGTHWYSWIKENKLHNIVSSAYAWGWARFLPEKYIVKIIKVIKPFDVYIQAITILFEAGAIFILLNDKLSIALILLFISFHLMVWLLSGILFWQFIIANLSLIWGILVLPNEVNNLIFNPINMFIPAVVFFLKVWKTASLAWWDTSFAGYIEYEVVGESGKSYGLYNDFMCPNERIYGQLYGHFLSDEKRINGHLGESKRKESFDAIEDAKKGLLSIEQIKKEIGESLYDSKLIEIHDKYIISFIKNYNLGKKKHIFPKWLKAPGGQMFYWGNFDRFKGQESIKELIVHYKEEFFDGEKINLELSKVVKKYYFELNKV